VLLKFASTLADVDAQMIRLMTPEVIAGIVELVPSEWLGAEPSFADQRAHRDAYLKYLSSRLRAPRAFVEEAIRARCAYL
jgi:hypothetical protein